MRDDFGIRNIVVYQLLGPFGHLVDVLAEGPKEDSNRRSVGSGKGWMLGDVAEEF